MAANKTIGGINVTISATTDKFSKGISAARRILVGFGRGIKDAIFSIKGLAAALATGAFVKFTHGAMESIDLLAKTADKLDISTEALAGLQLAADEANVSQTALEKGLQKMVRNADDASRGVGEAADAFKRLGVDTDALMQMTPDKQFLTLADAISKVSNKNEQLSLTTQIFGARAADMIHLIRGGRPVLEEAAEAAGSLGLAIDRESAAGVERAIDAFGRFKRAVSGIFRSVAVEIAPFIEVLSTKLTGFLSEGGKAKAFGAAIANAIIGTAKFIADGIQKMVGGVLEFVYDVKKMILSFRTSQFATGIGMGYKNGDDAEAAGQGVYDAWQRSRNWNDQAQWSMGIDSAVSAAREAAAAGVAANADNGKTGIAGFLGGMKDKALGSGALANAQQIGSAIVEGIKKAPAALSGAGMAADGFLRGVRNDRINSMMQSGPQHQSGSLSFAQSGSAESYRQRAAIRKQSESEKIWKQQLKALLDIAANTKPGSALPPANI